MELPNDLYRFCIEWLLKIGAVFPIFIEAYSDEIRITFKIFLPFSFPNSTYNQQSQLKTSLFQNLRGKHFRYWVPWKIYSFWHNWMVSVNIHENTLVNRWEKHAVISFAGNNVTLVTIYSLLNNTMVSTSIINEYKCNERDNDITQKQWIAVSQMEMVHYMLKY